MITFRYKRQFSVPIIRECEKTYKQTNCQENPGIIRDIITQFRVATTYKSEYIFPLFLIKFGSKRVKTVFCYL